MNANRTFFGLLLSVALFASGCDTMNVTQDVGQEEPKTSIPEIAAFAGIKVGYSTMEELEGRLGKGKVEVGGHPNSVRLWRVRGTSWVIATDYFDGSERGDVVDSLNITVDPEPRSDLPYTRLTRKDLTWAGEISLGMDEEDLLKLLKRNSWTVAKVDGGWQVEARGYSPLVGDNFINHWTARFTIKEKSVVGINLDARHDDVDSGKQAGLGQKKWFGNGPCAAPPLRGSGTANNRLQATPGCAWCFSCASGPAPLSRNVRPLRTS